jgi:hypothetical protein
MKIGYSLALLFVIAGCHSNNGGKSGGKPGAPGSSDEGSGTGTLVVQPADPVLQATVGQAPPTQQFSAVTASGKAVSATWSLIPSELGTIDSNGLFTATGTIAGKATVTAMSGGAIGSTSVTVRVATVQNGDPNYSSTPQPPGAGGYGGVGGDGPGAPVSPAQMQALDSTPSADSTVKLLYPYDATVWPRGLLAPLVQWRAGAHKFDSVAVHLQENGFEYKGYFAANNATAFVNLPLPQAAWQALGDSNQGETATVSIVFAEGAKAFGPYTMSWKFAPASLKGNVYYNSYGTYLVTNSDTADKLGRRYGAATLSIKPGATAPTVAAGVSSPNDGTGCRVCHTVSANGKTLLTQASNAQASDYTDTRFLDLLNDTTKGDGTSLGNELVAYPALSPDGSVALSSTGGFQYPGAPSGPSQLFNITPTGAMVVTASGLPTDFAATLPTFSPDGAHVAFNFWTGTFGSVTADQRSLVLVDFDPMAKMFANARTLYTPPSNYVTFSSFLPTGSGIVFQIELGNPSNSWGYTWQKNTGELWWVDIASGKATRLDQLNGLGYTPDNGQTGTHPPGLDAKVNYEPTVNPIASGGYVWIVFTSRRLYGNVATEDPWLSDPREYDATTRITDKKLWVAAFDLNAQPGTDPSHPAFYLPAQELHAGNARGYWTTGPCQTDGTACTSGDQCCGGYCPIDSGGTCTSTPPAMCAGLYDRCTKDSDCCSGGKGISCINHICTQSNPIE